MRGDLGLHQIIAKWETLGKKGGGKIFPMRGLGGEKTEITGETPQEIHSGEENSRDLLKKGETMTGPEEEERGRTLMIGGTVRKFMSPVRVEGKGEDLLIGWITGHKMGVLGGVSQEKAMVT